MADFTDVAPRFVAEQSTNSTLKDDVVANNEFQDGTISGIANQSKSSSSPNKKDDGISGQRMAIIFRSVKLEGIHQIQDPGILDVVSSMQGQQTTVFVHYGFAAGTSVTLPRNRLNDVTKMSRFYELLTNSDTEFVDRDGQKAKVEMIGTNHGRLVNFMEEGTVEVVDRTPPEAPPAPLAVRNFNPQPKENKTPEPPVLPLEEYLRPDTRLVGGLEQKHYDVVTTGRKADQDKQELFKIQLDGVDLLENRREGDSLVMTATKQAWNALIIMETYWDKLGVIYRHNKGDMKNTDWIPLMGFVQNSYRSDEVNERREGTKSSHHRKGTAFDLHRASRIDKKLWARLFVYTAAEAGFTGFGIGNGFCHADTRKTPSAWDYGGPVKSYTPHEWHLGSGKIYPHYLKDTLDMEKIDEGWGNTNWLKAFTS